MPLSGGAALEYTQSMRWEDRPATPDRILELVPARARSRALELALPAPGRAHWKSFLEGVLAGLGTLLTAAGVIFFIAYNWSSLGRFAKFGLLELVIVASFLAAWRAGLDTPAGRWALTLGGLLIGPLLALYGQTYQLKADSWRLFAGWAALMLPWTLAARHRPLWLAEWVVVNVSLFAAWEHEWWAIGLVNLFWWMLAERRYLSWEAGRWTLYASALMVLACWTLPAWGTLLDLEPDVYVALTGLVAAGIFWVYRRHRRDGFMLALACGSLIGCATCLLARGLIDFDEVFGFLVVAGLLVAQVSVATWWLRREVAA